MTKLNEKADFKTSFGKRLRTHRLERNLPRMKDLADLIGVTQQSISYYESGDRLPDAITLTKLAAALGCTTDYLLFIENAPTHESSDLSKATGLSVTATEELQSYKIMYGDFCSEFLNEMIVSDQFPFLAVYFARWKKAVIDGAREFDEGYVDGMDVLKKQAAILERKDLPRYRMIKSFETFLEHLEEDFYNGQHHEV